MRGKLTVHTALRRSRRITPADAGKTTASPSQRHSSQDHPRGCGENMRGNCRYTRPIGSPPRMRGKLVQLVYSDVGVGITPADAGKTRYFALKVEVFWDHPRGCGENLPIPDKRLGTLGSPPRMRGKPVLLKFSVPLSGITPAGAGKTIEGRRQNIYVQDHPRRCGENPLRRSAPRRARGSPPQVRGKPADMAASPQVTRITPAGAGKTRC